MSSESTEGNRSWKQGTQEAIDFLRTTAEDLATSRTIDSDVRAKAITVASGLVMSLSAFGLAQAAEQARDAVTTLRHAGLPQPERLQQQVEALHDSLAPVLGT